MQLERITILAIMTLLLAGVTLAANEPTAPSSLAASDPSTFAEGNYAPQSVEAIAGNITALSVYAIGQTKTWQGYYGNVSATITLDDANNFTFYNWTAAEPRGQIYATLNSSITWGSVGCYNFSESTFANWQTIEDYYTIATDDVDGVNETYTATNHPSFEVGSRTITGCPTTYIFQNDTAQTANFVNVLLYDNTSAVNQTGWIYTTLMENKSTGSSNELLCYNGAPCDFQILVNDDGHGTDVATTTYYFWVEVI